MRWLMVDYAKAKGREKRGRGIVRIEFEESFHGGHNSKDVSVLVKAMEKLGSISSRAAQSAEMRYLLGMNLTEIAKFLEVSEGTVKRDLEFAKEWLVKELHRE